MKWQNCKQSSWKASLARIYDQVQQSAKQEIETHNQLGYLKPFIQVFDTAAVIPSQQLGEDSQAPVMEAASSSEGRRRLHSGPSVPINIQKYSDLTTLAHQSQS